MLSVLHCVAVCCSVLQYVAVCCSALQYIGGIQSNQLQQSLDCVCVYVCVCVCVHQV